MSLTTTFKKTLALITVFLLPFVFLLSVLFFVFIPSSGKTPDVDFIYAIYENVRNQNYNKIFYRVDPQTQKIENINTDMGVYDKQQIPMDDMEKIQTGFGDVPQPVEPSIYYHNVKTNQSRKISLAEAKKYNLREIDREQDFTLELNTYVNSQNIWSHPFYSGSYSYVDPIINNNSEYWVIVGGGRRVKQNVMNKEGTNVFFIGWVKK
jgi:hypothetical protein